METATPLAAEAGRGAKQTEAVSVDVRIELDKAQPCDRISLLSTVVRVGGIGCVQQVQPGVGDKLGERPKASEVLEALLGVCRVACQNGWGPELLCQWLQIHWADFLAKDEVLLNLIREFKLGPAFSHIGQYHFTDDTVGSLILFVLGQMKPTKGETAATFVLQVDRFAKFLYLRYFSAHALYITLVTRLEANVGGRCRVFV